MLFVTRLMLEKFIHIPRDMHLSINRGESSTLKGMAERSFRRLRCRFVTEGNEVERLLYVRPFHLEHADEKGRTLSVAGVPVFLQPPDIVLEGLFAGCGPVDRVLTHPRQVTEYIYTIVSLS